MDAATIPDKERQTLAASRRAARLKLVREWHLYLGTLFAPSILFFALTGSLQLFGLHESHPGERYQAPAWVQRLGQIHKNQTMELRHWPPPGARSAPRADGTGGSIKQHEERPFADAPRTASAAQPGVDATPTPVAERARPREERGPNKLTMALKIFFLAAALGLVASTLLGIYMAFKFNRSQRLVWGLLALGVFIPGALLALMA